MNFMDLVFILLFLGTLAAGFFQGMIRLAVLFLAFYLSVVLASLYYPVLGNFFFTRFGGERFASEYIGFLLVLIVGFAVLAAAGLYTFRYAVMPGKLFYVDKIGGLFIALLLGGIILGVLAALLWQLFVISGGKNIDLPLFRALGRSVEDSFLISYFAEYILPESYIFARPILPEGASLIFEV